MAFSGKKLDQTPAMLLDASDGRPKLVDKQDAQGL
jgi:hypothetical protein